MQVHPVFVLENRGMIEAPRAIRTPGVGLCIASGQQELPGLQALKEI